MPTISFIVLTYNSSKYIGNLLDSLYRHFGTEVRAGEAEIILVDNDSKDETLRIVRERKDEGLKVIDSGNNGGFAAGINLGAKKAAGKNLVMINPDAEYEKGDLFEVVKEFGRDEKLGVVGGSLRTYAGEMEKSCGKFLKTFEVLLLILGLDEALGVRLSPSKKTRVDFVSGGFLMIPKTLFDAVGGFDEDFFMYIEDMELCYRVQKKGYKVVFDPGISIRHAGQGSSSRGFAVRNIFRGLLIFQKKHGNFLTYNLVKIMLTTKAALLVLAGKMLNNRYLIETYGSAI